MFSGALETGQKRFILTGVEVEKGAEAQVAGSVWSGSCWGLGSLFAASVFSWKFLRIHLRHELGGGMGEGWGM